MGRDMSPALHSYEDTVFAGMISNVKSDVPLDGEYVKLKTKMPYEVYLASCVVFNYAQHELGSEGMVLYSFFDGQWHVQVPDQWVGPAHVDSHAEYRAGEIHDVVGDAHSHPKMNAFFSGTDEYDMQKHRKGLFMCFNSSDAGFSIYSTVVRAEARVRGRVFELKPEDVFELPRKDALPAPLPEGWEKRIHRGECPKCTEPNRDENRRRQFEKYLGGQFKEYELFKNWKRRMRSEGYDPGIWGAE